MRHDFGSSNNLVFPSLPPGLHGDDILPEIVWIQRQPTLRHCVQVACYAEELARLADFSQREVALVRAAALLHDIGKVGISEKILHKAGALSPEEFAEMRNHSQYGYDFLSQFSDLAEHGQVVLHHHERWDGAGYPTGLAGEDIPLASRLIHLADAVDVMLRPRSYKWSMPMEWVLGELSLNSGTQFDPGLTDLAMGWIKTGQLSRCRARIAA
jgi:putative nucleotidyltransferase with HDIG domain